jgi:hypothetical protein
LIRCPSGLARIALRTSVRWTLGAHFPNSEWLWTRCFTSWVKWKRSERGAGAAAALLGGCGVEAADVTKRQYAHFFASAMRRGSTRATFSA